MMTFNPTLIRLCLAAAVVASAPVAQAQDAEQTVSGEEVRRLWVGKKIFARSPTSGLLDFHMRADGTTQLSMTSMNDTGTWRPTETGYCATWQRIRAGQERCFTVVKRGGTTYVLNPDKSISVEVLRVVGD
ncbi:hypothetical protein [Ramlibacter sp.]|uniref:hypothetical protein n=1 Tax=Ramlibacter sp. TaxID=1917967 RepID=UPI0035B40ABF